MDANDKVRHFKVIAAEPQSTGTGTSTVLETGRADELVIVGKLEAAVLENAVVKSHLGDDEIAVVIPKSLLLQLAKDYL
jgi:hypothetical protein